MCDMRVLTYWDSVWLCEGLLLRLCRFSVMVFGLASLAPRCFLQLSSAPTVFWARSCGSSLLLGLFYLLPVAQDLQERLQQPCSEPWPGRVGSFHSVRNPYERVPTLALLCPHHETWQLFIRYTIPYTADRWPTDGL